MSSKKPATPARKKARKRVTKKKSAAAKPSKEAPKEGAGAEGSPPDPPPPDLPFDARFFEVQFPNLLPPPLTKGKSDPEPPPEPIDEPRPYVVTVALGDGTQFDVHAIDQLDEHWMLVAVLESSRLTVGEEAARRFVFVPYASIARVEVTGTESRLRPIGFHLRGVEAKKKAGKKKATTKKKAAKKKATTKKKAAKKKATKRKAAKRKATAKKRAVKKPVAKRARKRPSR